VSRGVIDECYLPPWDTRFACEWRAVRDWLTEARAILASPASQQDS